MPSSEPLSSASEFINELAKPSTTSRLSNLACPSDTASKDSSPIPQSNAPGEIACSPQASVPSVGISPAVNSSSTRLNPENITGTDPDKVGVYMETDATPDQQSHCLNFGAHQYQICWEVLNVTGYLQDWIAFNQRKCEDEDMGFADCFLYLEVGAGANCTAFTGRSQCPSPDPRTFIGRKQGSHAYYVSFNIWNIQNWFFTYYLAIGGANGLTLDNVNTITRTLNLPTPKAFKLLDLLAGLAYVFGLISPSGYAGVIPRLGEKTGGFGAQAPGEYLLRAIQNSPTLSRCLLSTGDLKDSDVQVAELGTQLARIVSQLQSNVQNALVLVMSNVSVFQDFVSDGFFSTQIENLNTITQNVTLSLNTYIVSQALQNDKVIITRALDTDVNALQLNGSANGYDTGCGYGYNEWNMCGNWWYDSTNHISYGLESQQAMLNNYTDPLISLFNLGITTPELLFLNSQICADAAGSTQGNAPGTTLTTGTGMWNTECISNLKICTWDTVNMGVEYEFTDCPKEDAFGEAGCGASLELVQVVVPTTYLGPYLTRGLLTGVVCNHWDKGMGSPNG
ncbi:MAG: hypothetical protein L6R41_002554 [Letrouitia leprolyta]|nr:MAG: hypothetical protein L6R41_002554 [Letrouitia leprolyta]